MEEDKYASNPRDRKKGLLVTGLYQTLKIYTLGRNYYQKSHIYCTWHKNTKEKYQCRERGYIIMWIKVQREARYNRVLQHLEVHERKKKHGQTIIEKMLYQNHVWIYLS